MDYRKFVNCDLLSDGDGCLRKIGVIRERAWNIDIPTRRTERPSGVLNTPRLLSYDSRKIDGSPHRVKERISSAHREALSVLYQYLIKDRNVINAWSGSILHIGYASARNTEH
ncbi:hypothetical protein WA026_001873 [Henosepilachna vigintioctopunctata]|uniref:Uncharacterized protein n=1 Tax=Henosepilachna vigintioctopunctata TaxID=420089 RepID=A0AAW1UT68_9CUCU